MGFAVHNLFNISTNITAGIMDNKYKLCISGANVQKYRNTTNKRQKAEIAKKQ